MFSVQQNTLFQDINRIMHLKITNADPCQSKETGRLEHPGSSEQSGGVSVLSARGFHSTGLESHTDTVPFISEDPTQGTSDTRPETSRSFNLEAIKSTKTGREGSELGG